LEPPTKPGITTQLGPEQLDGDRSLEPLVHGVEHLGLASAAERVAQPVPTGDHLPRHVVLSQRVAARLWPPGTVVSARPQADRDRWAAPRPMALDPRRRPPQEAGRRRRAARRARRMSRRSSSLVPPQIPYSWFVLMANSRHAAWAAQPSHTVLAAAMAATAAPVTPTGKKTAGSTSRQAACWRHRSTSQAAHRIDSTGSSGVVALIHT